MEEAFQSIGPDGEKPKLISHYISCIRINGKPILPPLMTPERRKEMAAWREMAIEVEERTRRQRTESISSDGISTVETKSTPARPHTLNLAKNNGKKRVSKYRQTLEHRLALDSGSEAESDNKRWSPLKADSLQDLRLHVTADSDSSKDTPDTVTASPRLTRQGSYTILTPSDALKSSRLDSDTPVMQTSFQSSASHPGMDASASARTDSGRKTWDLRSAQHNWSNRVTASDTESEYCPTSPSKSLTRPNSVPCTQRVPLRQVQNISAADRPTRQDLPSVREQLSSLSEMMISLTLRHEQQRRQMQKEQDEERMRYQKLLTYKQGQILDYITSVVSSQNGRENAESCPSSCVGEKPDIPSFRSDSSPAKRRIQAKKATGGVDCRAAKVSCMDTDVDFSLMDDATVVTRDFDDESECWSSVSSRCSTISNDVLPTSQRNGHLRFDYSDNLPLYDKAATVICSHVRGYLTRRLMKTEPVLRLRRSLLDSVIVSKKISATNEALGPSDLKFMEALRRQIFSDWDRFYDIFMRKRISKQMAMIRADRERGSRNSSGATTERRISTATMSSLRRRNVMSSSLNLPKSPSSFRRSCFKMSNSVSGALSSTK